METDNAASGDEKLRDALLTEIARWTADAQTTEERAWAGVFAGSVRSVIEEAESNG